MPRLIAFICNDDSLTPLAVSRLKPHLEFPATETSGGFGFGWLQDGRSLLRTSPKPGVGTPDFVDLMADIPARAVLGHIRSAEDGTAPPLDLQPYRFRKWVFAHEGEVPETKRARDELLSTVPEFLRRNVKGSSGSEVFGHMFWSELHRRGLLDKAAEAHERAAALASFTAGLQVQAAIGEFAAVTASERSLFCAAIGCPLYYREIRGIDGTRDEPLFAGHRPKATSYPAFKALVVTNAPLDTDEWEQVPDRHVLWVDRAWEPGLFPIDD